MYNLDGIYSMTKKIKAISKEDIPKPSKHIELLIAAINPENPDVTIFLTSQAMEIIFEKRIHRKRAIDGYRYDTINGSKRHYRNDACVAICCMQF